jgi:hypothetical protein
MGFVIYSLCALGAMLCAWLLLRAYRRSAYRLLLWGGLCFVGLTVGNVLLMVDKLILPTQVDLSILRHSVTIASLMVLLYGLIWDAE